jgi:hypothetical protein
MVARKQAKTRVRVLAIEAEGDGAELAQALQKALEEFTQGSANGQSRVSMTIQERQP